MSAVFSPTRIIHIRPPSLRLCRSVPRGGGCPPYRASFPASSTGRRGCLFSPRCRNAMDLCRSLTEPAGPALGEALCHFPLIVGHSAGPSRPRGRRMTPARTLTFWSPRTSPDTITCRGDAFAAPATLKARRRRELHPVPTAAPWRLSANSGCGKSTLARIVAMIEEPTAGEPAIAARTWSTTPAPGRCAGLRPKVQIVFQNPYGSLNPRQRIGDAAGRAAAGQHVTLGGRAARARPRR